MLVVALVLINSFTVAGEYFFDGPNLFIKKLVLKAGDAYQLSDIDKIQYREEVSYFDQVELSHNYCDFNFVPQSVPCSLWAKLWGASKKCAVKDAYVTPLRIKGLLIINKVTQFDGYQLHSEKSQKRYYALKNIANYYGVSIMLILSSYNEYKKHLNNRCLFKSPAGSMITNIALNYPYVAYVSHTVQGGKNELMAHHVNDPIADRPSLQLPEGLKKMSWLKGKNLLALTTDGKVFVTDVSSVPYQMHKQTIVGSDAIDMMAVDTQSPWRVLLFSKVKGLIYLNFGSSGYIEDDAGTTFFLKKKNLTYKNIIPADALPQKIYRLWFNGNNIGVVSGDYELSTYTLSEHCVAVPLVL